MAAAAIPALSAIGSSSFAIPAIGAAAGAMLNKDNRLQGALLGGLGGALAGPAMGGLLAGPGSQAGMLAAQEAGLGTAGMGWGGATSGLSGMLNGASGMMSNPSMKIAMQGMDMMGQPQGGQPQPMAQPMQQPYAQKPQYPIGTLEDLRKRQAMYQPRKSAFM